MKDVAETQLSINVTTPTIKKYRDYLLTSFNMSSTVDVGLKESVMSPNKYANNIIANPVKIEAIIPINSQIFSDIVANLNRSL